MIYTSPDGLSFINQESELKSGARSPEVSLGELGFYFDVYAVVLYKTILEYTTYAGCSQLPAEGYSPEQLRIYVLSGK